MSHAFSVTLSRNLVLFQLFLFYRWSNKCPQKPLVIFYTILFRFNEFIYMYDCFDLLLFMMHVYDLEIFVSYGFDINEMSWIKATKDWCKSQKQFFSVQFKTMQCLSSWDLTPYKHRHYIIIEFLNSFCDTCK